MERVLGFGGVFIRASDKEALARWYRDNLGINLHEEWWGCLFPLTQSDDPGGAHNVWSVYSDEASESGERPAPYSLSFRVRDLDAMLAQLKENGNEADDGEHSEYGDFGYVIDPEGNRIELWQPPTDLPPDWRDAATG
jgi:catechol 2,3-dioxygenase-like lactoylglutathione lyase family enzyme